jgi:chromatin segregation and condensation protein Rec8/ScpA/Scc1 (kleisin family)
MYTIKDFPCTLEEFSGPFELLLSLANREEIDTRRILITEVVAQFLKKGGHPVEDKAAFAHDAAWLHILKSLSLNKERLEPDAELELGQDLKTILDSFDKLKNAQQLSIFLNKRQEVELSRAYRPKSTPHKATKTTQTKATLQDLNSCFQTLLRKRAIQPHTVEPDEILFEEEKQAVIQLLPLAFISLFDELGRSHQIIRFLVLLELLKEGQIEVLFKENILYISVQHA